MSRTRQTFVALLGLVVCGAAALAQQAPPRPQGEPSSPTWLYYIVLGLLAAATIAASVIPSKRGHLD